MFVKTTYTINELADIINVTPCNIYYLIKKQKLKAQQVSRGVYEVLEPFDHLIRSNKAKRYKNIPFSEAELDILKEFYVINGAKFCQKLLQNRSIYSIQVKAGKLNLHRRTKPQVGYKFCYKCKQEKVLEDFNKEKRFKTGRASCCKTCYRVYYNTPDKKLHKKLYDQKRIKNKYKNNVYFRLQLKLRKRLRKALKAQNAHKKSKTVDLLGCTIQELKIYIENQFKPGMTWQNNNYRGWHIDHIIPCASFDLNNIEEQKKCFHYTNLQPLWAFENIAKRDKIMN